jgi:arylformamidase
MKIYDISLALGGKTIIYPGNPPVTIEERRGTTSVHSLVSLGTHTGTHVDAPRHVFTKGRGLSEIPLERFVGTCRVLDMTREKKEVSLAALKKARIKKGERVLLKTVNSKKGFAKFRDDYIFLSGDGAGYLANIKVALVGIDYLSIKKRGGSDQRPHTSLLAKNIPILEGIDLQRVRPGNYMLVCLPLKFGTIDGAPARAVLMKP